MKGLRRATVCFALSCMAMLAGCLPTVGEDPYRSIRIEMDDTVYAMESIRILVLSQNLTDTLQVLWNGPPPPLGALFTPRDFDGFRLDIYMEGRKSGSIRFRRMLTWLRTGINAPIDLPLPSPPTGPDSVPPTLNIFKTGLNDIVLGDPFMSPEVTCRDYRDGLLDVERSGNLDLKKPGVYTLRFSCEDNSGNRTYSDYEVRVLDPGLPVIRLKGADTLYVKYESAFTDLGATCWDEVDGMLAVESSGYVITAVRGPYFLRFSCRDSEGHFSLSVLRTVLVY